MKYFESTGLISLMAWFIYIQYFKKYILKMFNMQKVIKWTLWSMQLNVLVCVQVPSAVAAGGWLPGLVPAGGHHPEGCAGRHPCGQSGQAGWAVPQCAKAPQGRDGLYRTVGGERVVSGRAFLEGYCNLKWKLKYFP